LLFGYSSLKARSPFRSPGCIVFAFMTYLYHEGRRGKSLFLVAGKIGLLFPLCTSKWITDSNILYLNSFQSTRRIKNTSKGDRFFEHCKSYLPARSASLIFTPRLLASSMTSFFSLTSPIPAIAPSFPTRFISPKPTKLSIVSRARSTP